MGLVGIYYGGYYSLLLQMIQMDINELRKEEDLIDSR